MNTLNVQKKNFWKICLMVLGALAFASCSKDSDSDSSEETTVIGSGGSGSACSSCDAGMDLSVVGSTSGIALLGTDIPVIGKDGAQIGVLTVNEARMVLEEIKFKTEDDDDSAEETETEDDDSESSDFEGPFEVDLLTNVMNPQPDTASIDSGAYDRIELKMHKVDDDDAEALALPADDALIDRSVYVEGTYTPTSGSSVNFAFSHDLGEEFELDAAGGLAVDSGVTLSVVIAFRFAEWFDFSNTDVNEDYLDLSDLTGDITLSKDSEDAASKIRQVIKKNIQLSADYGEDEDGDGELSESEDTEEDEEDE